MNKQMNRYQYIYLHFFQEYHFESSMGKNILFLSDITQSSLNNAFVEAMPWLSFGRKNIGYLYAIANGATVIWDFDDDNILKFWMKGATPDDSLEIDHFIDDLNGNFNKYFFLIFSSKVFVRPNLILGD